MEYLMSVIKLAFEFGSGLLRIRQGQGWGHELGMGFGLKLITTCVDEIMDDKLCPIWYESKTGGQGTWHHLKIS